MNCSCDLKSFSRSLEQFFLTVGQNNFGNKISFMHILQTGNWKQDFTIPELKNVPVRHHSKAKNPTQAGAGANNDHDSAPVFQGIYTV